MPFLNSDLKNLEWRTLLEMSGDKVGIDEILSKLDVHADNQKRFGLPSRLIAKVFLFRWIYRGSAYAYSLDPDFAPIGGQKFWQKIIDAANEKYSGIYEFQNQQIEEAKNTGFVTNHITGVKYVITPKQKHWGLEWPEPDITNYPNQGFGASITALCRIMANRSIRSNDSFNNRIRPILTVHDSLLYDCGSTDCALDFSVELDNIAMDLGRFWAARYGRTLVVPHEFEHEIGVNYGHMHKVTPGMLKALDARNQ